MIQGIYTSPSDDSFRTDEDIKRTLYLAGEHPDPDFITPLPADKSFGYWSGRMKQRQEQMIEVDDYVREATIALPPTVVALSYQGDLHGGAKHVDYQRFENDALTIAHTPFHYAIPLGDMADHFSFNPAQMVDEIEQIPEQAQYVWSYFDLLASNKKLLCAMVGNHDDKWARKTGHSLYRGFSQRTGAYLMRGLSRLTVQVGDVEYKIGLSHAFQGRSIRDVNWAQKRAYQEAGLWGADMVASGHTHEKGYQWRSYREFGNKEGLSFLALQSGTYKADDSWIDDQGMGEKARQEMGGISVVLMPGHKQIIPFSDIQEANEFLVDWHTHHAT